jgi:type VI secretion system secreted protein Hcp
VTIADMFLKIQGVTGEANDADHKGEIQIISWSWGMQSPTALGGQATGKATLTELKIVKRVDQASPTLMSFLRNRKTLSQASLVVRKAGKTPLEYFKIELENVVITSLQAGSNEAELVEHVNLGFTKFRAIYTPQDLTGARGGGANVFETDTQAAS